MGRWPLVFGAVVLFVCPTGAGVYTPGAAPAWAQATAAPDIVFQSAVLERTVGLRLRSDLGGLATELESLRREPGKAWR